jgi:hypothetical protein
VAVKDAILKAWRSLRSTRQRIEAGIAFVLAVGCVIAAAVQVGPALAETKIEGEPVPAEMLPAIVVGATSCPALTGPRLAGQLMAASAFEATAKSDTGHGLAGLDAADWKKWAPWQQAQRTDVLANVLALAHRTCKFVGQVRDGGLEGDLWEEAVAADFAGVSAVVKADGVPKAAQEKVDTIVGYANWYADRPEFTDEPAPDDSKSGVPAGVAVPDAFVKPIVEAGDICPGILPAPRVAAQLMALSGFNANLRGPSGGLGIAQFTESMWKKYRPSTDASVWDPEVAIPAMGTAMCDLKNQLSGMRTEGRSNDPHTLALAAYQWGITAVRSEGGVPRKASVNQLSDLVTGYVGNYSSDARLKPEPKPVPTPSSAAPSPSASADPSKAPEAKPKPAETKATEKPAARKPASKWNAGDRWQLTNALSGRVAEVPGDDSVTAGGTTIQLYDSDKSKGLGADKGKDQWWRITEAGDPGWVTITNDFTKKVLAVRDASGDNGAEVVMYTPKAGDHNQQWQLKDGGDGRFFIVNRKSGKALDILGDDCCSNNGTALTQWDLQDYAVDQHWKLTK